MFQIPTSVPLPMEVVIMNVPTSFLVMSVLVMMVMHWIVVGILAMVRNLELKFCYNYAIFHQFIRILTRCQ